MNYFDETQFDFGLPPETLVAVLGEFDTDYDQSNEEDITQ